MAIPNSKLWFFSATTVAATIVPANGARRRITYQSYTLPEENDANSVWLDDTGNVAVPFQCKQVLPGQIYDYGGPTDRITPTALSFQSCPTGAISVITSAGTHRGVIEEFF